MVVMIQLFLSIFLSSIFWQQEPVMAWNANDRLEWSDFKAAPQQRAEVIAVTASGLSFGYSTTRYPNGRIDYEFDVTAHFYPEKSWFMKDLVTNITLSHERLHFDITELHARKFRKRVKTARFSSNIDAEIDVIYNQINKELRAMQKQYDTETSHSRLVEKQEEWNRQIQEELKKMEAYR